MPQRVNFITFFYNLNKDEPNHKAWKILGVYTRNYGYVELLFQECF